MANIVNFTDKQFENRLNDNLEELVQGMNTSTSEAGGCHYAGIALCSSRTRATRNTVCQPRKGVTCCP